MELERPSVRQVARARSWVVLVGIVALLFVRGGEGGAATPPSSRERARAALAALEPGPCLVEVLAPARELRIAVVVYPDGRWSLAVRDDRPALRTDDGVRACLEKSMRSRLADILPSPPRQVTVISRTFAMSATVYPTVGAAHERRTHGPTDGSVGASCGWGDQRSGEVAPSSLPAPCRAGLTCCTAGGVAGAGSVCMAVPAGECPDYP